MTTAFNESTKQIADELIAMSVLLANKMETWADVFVRHPESQGVNVSAGFISNAAAASRLEVVIDVQAPADASTAVVRTKAIETMSDASGNERFNSISMNYAVDYTAARQLVEKAGSLTREEIAHLLHAETSQLVDLIISDETGRDAASDQLLGKRYDLESDALSALSGSTADELLEVLRVILDRLKQTAALQANA